MKIHPIELKISTAYLIEDEGCILVDTGSPNEGRKIAKAVEQLGISMKDISLIVHTHGHSDHCGSTKELMDDYNIPTALHPADNHYVLAGNNGYLKPINLMGKLLKPFVDVPFPPFTPDIELQDGDTLDKYGVKAKIHSTPGHTKGSISVELPNKSVIVGDLIMGGVLGGKLFPSIPDYQYYIEDFDEINRSIQKLTTLDIDNFLLMHGGPVTKRAVINKFKKHFK